MEKNKLKKLVEQLFDTEAKRSHDKVEGNDYHIINWEGNLIYKHKKTGFAPRLRNGNEQLDWYKKYGDYINRVYPIIDAEASGYADGNIF